METAYLRLSFRSLRMSAGDLVPEQSTGVNPGVLMSQRRSPGNLALGQSVLRATLVNFMGDPEESALLPAPVRRLVRGVAAGLAILLLLTAAALLGAQQRYDGRIYPQVMAGGTELGGKPVDEARGLLQAESAKHQAQTVTFSYADKTWTP